MKFIFMWAHTFWKHQQQSNEQARYERKCMVKQALSLETSDLLIFFNGPLHEMRASEWEREREIKLKFISSAFLLFHVRIIFTFLNAQAVACAVCHCSLYGLLKKIVRRIRDGNLRRIFIMSFLTVVKWLERIF